MSGRPASYIWASASGTLRFLIALVALAVGFGFATMAVADDGSLGTDFETLDIVNQNELEQHRGREGSDMTGLTQVNLSNTQDFEATIQDSSIQADSIVNGSISFGDHGAGTFAGPTIIINNTGGLNNFNVGQQFNINLQ